MFVGSLGNAAPFTEELGLADPILVDEDESTSRLYFISNEEDGFAQYPVHFVIDADGVIALAERQVNPDGLEAAIDAALEARSE